MIPYADATSAVLSLTRNSLKKTSYATVSNVIELWFAMEGPPVGYPELSSFRIVSLMTTNTADLCTGG